MKRTVELLLVCGIVVAVNAAAASGFIAKPGDDLTAVRDRVRAERPKDGTPEKPLDLGFVDVPPARHDARRYVFQEGRWKGFIDRPALRALREKGELTTEPFRTGDFNLRPDAKLKELMPQFQPIPFDKIGLYRDEWRTGL